MSQAGYAQSPDDKLKNPGRPKAGEELFVNHEVLVKFKSALAPAELNAFNRQISAGAADREGALAAFHRHYRTRTSGLPVLGWQRLHLPDGQTVADALAQLRSNPLVEKIEPNYLVKAVASAMSTTYTRAPSTTRFMWTANPNGGLTAAKGIWPKTRGMPLPAPQT